MPRKFPSVYTLLDRLLQLRSWATGLGSRRLRGVRSQSRLRLTFEPLEERSMLDARPLPLPVLFVGSGVGHTPDVRAYNAETGALNWEMPAYGTGFQGGVRVAAGDFNADGYPDVVLAPGPGRAPLIRILDGKTGVGVDGPLGAFQAFGKGDQDGTVVAAADIDGDGCNDVIAATVTAAGPRVRVFSGVTGSVISQFSIPGVAFQPSLTIAAADFTADGKAEVVVGAGGSSQVRIYNPLTGSIISGPYGAFNAFGAGYSGGVNVATDSRSGDVDGDGIPDLVVGTDSGIPRVRVFSGANGALLDDFTPFGTSATGGTRVGLAYVDDDSHADIVVGTGPGPSAAIKVFSGATGTELTAPLSGYTPFGSYSGGVFVAAANDPPVVRMKFASASVSEGGKSIDATVTMLTTATVPVTVTYATSNGTATAGSDYTAKSGSVVFAPGQQIQIVSIPIAQDTISELTETFNFTLTGVSGGGATLGSPAVEVISILDDDDTPGVSIGSVSHAEGDSGVQNYDFPVTLSNASSQTITVHYATSDGSASAGSDYTATSGTLTFSPGQTTKTVTVPVAGDLIYEADETFTVALSNATNAGVKGVPGTGTILNNDSQPSLSIGNVSQNEGNSGTTNFAFTVTLSAVSSLTTTVNYATANGTATAGVDYTSASGTLTFAPGETSKTVMVAVTGEAVYEPNETFTVNLSNPSGATVQAGHGSGTGTINNDDPLPAISIGGVTQNEGASGTLFSFPVTLSNPSSQSITVTYGTANGTAVSGSDYTATTGTLTFAPGETTKTVTVSVIGDSVYEADETFTVALTNPNGATIQSGQGTATGTIVNDDPQPTVSIGDVSQSEGNAGNSTFTFPITLSAASGLPAAVTYSTTGGTASAGSDYSTTSGTLVFAPGETTKTVTVTVLGDTLYEADETFTVLLSNPTGVTIPSGQETGTGTIVNDDPQPIVSVGDGSGFEGDSGTTTVTFPVTLSAPSGLPTTVTFATADGTAEAGLDYQGSSGSVTFAPGETSKLVSITVMGDTAVESNEMFALNLTGANGATLSATAASATGSILSDDGTTISVTNVTQAEGTGADGVVTFTVSLANSVGTPVTVNYTTTDGTATAGSDYTATNGTLTFAPGETTQTVDVVISADGLFEPDETFTLDLSNAVGATIPEGQEVGTATLTNDDEEPTFTIDNVTQDEGTGADTTFTFTVSLSAPSGEPTTVDYATGDGSAYSFDDYVETTGTLTFEPGEVTKTVSVTVTGDDQHEADETFTVTLSNAQGAAISATAGIGTGTITNDDPLPPLAIETDSDPAILNEPAEFWLPDDREYTSIEWDLNYDGIAFNPDTQAGTDTFVDTTFDAVGERTVAARVTNDAGVTTIVTLDVTVAYPAPDVTVPDDLTVTVGVPVTLQASADSADGIASVEWAFSYFTDDYEWNFETDPSLTSLTATDYVFEHAGEYDVQVTVTADDGQTGEGWFHVTVNDVPPPATAAVTSPITEGDEATFTVHNLDPDTLDLVTFYADWYGDGTFDELTYDPDTGTGDYTLNPDGSVSFTHRYTDTPNDPNDPDAAESGTFPAVIRVEDEWGLSTDFPVPVVVNNAPPDFDFSFQQADYPYSPRQPAATVENDGVNVWGLWPGDALAFTQLAGTPNPDEDSEYKFHWIIDGKEQVTETPTFVPDDTNPGTVIHFEAWVTDGEHTESEHYQGVGVVASGSGAGELGVMRPYPIYGTLTANGDDPAFGGGPSPEYANYLGTSDKKNIQLTLSPVTFQFTLDPAVQAMATSKGYGVTYNYHIRTYDVEEFSWGTSNFDLIPEASFDDESSDGAYSIVGGPLNQEDREIQIYVRVSFVHNGQVVESIDWGGSPSVILDTPKSATYVQQGLDAYAAIRGFANQFADKGQALVDAIITGPGPTQVFNVLTQGFAQAVNAFVAELPTEQFVGKLYSWLMGGASLSQFTNLSNITDPDTLSSFLLQYSGLTWDHVYQVIQQQLGAGNIAALETVAGWFNNIDANNPTPTAMLAMLDKVGNGLDVNQLKSDLQNAVQAKITQGVTRAGVEFAAKFLPGPSIILSLSRGLGWVVSNAGQMAAVFDKFVSCIDFLDDPEEQAILEVKDKLLEGFNASIPTFLNFAASQLGLGSLPTQMRRAVEFVPTRVDTAIRTAVAKAAAAVLPAVTGANARLFDGKLAPERQFTYQNKTYVLWVAEVDKIGTVVKLAELTGPGVYKYIGELKADSFANRDTPSEDGKTPTQHIGELIAAAKSLKNAVKTKPQQGAANPLPALKAQQDAIAPTAVPTNQGVITATSALEDKVIADIIHNACKALNAGCFAAGTKLLTKSGWRAVETIQRGDEVASRHESDPAGDVTWKVVEDTFQRTGCILHVHVGGQVIRTTPEHPFWVEGEGWVAAGSLKEGDRIATLSGEWVTVLEVFDTQTWEPVYNLRVADHHTYFVGTDEWGFAVWAHNTICGYQGYGEAAYNASYARMADDPAITNPADAILKAERAARNMPPAGPNDESHCLAYTEVGGQRFFADNRSRIQYNWPTVQSGQLPAGRGVNPRGRDHAEIQSMLVAGEANIRGHAIVIFTDRQPCAQCDKLRAMENAARILGATSLTVWGPCGGIGPIIL